MKEEVVNEGGRHSRSHGSVMLARDAVVPDLGGRKRIDPRFPSSAKESVPETSTASMASPNEDDVRG